MWWVGKYGVFLFALNNFLPHTHTHETQAEEIFKVMCPDDEFLPLHVNADEDAKGNAVRIRAPASTIYQAMSFALLFGVFDLFINFLLALDLISVRFCLCLVAADGCILQFVRR